ncbi:MAG: hypothetical protein HY340_01960 [Candidatus Kerfeldbacteria bacterium]|nr:hypothetical protein [Candidatus Kerfeldbacteria bacterium]
MTRLLLLTLSLAAFGLPVSVRAAATTVRIDATAIQKGYTASAGEREFRVAIWPNLVTEPVAIRLTERTGDALPSPEGTTRVSAIWEFDVLRAGTTTKDPLILRRPFTLSLKCTSSTLYRKRIMYWDRNKKTWVGLPTSYQESGGTAVARMRLPYAQVAVFEDTRAVVGRASWFYHRLGDSAASNDFPFGSTLRVTNTETKQATTVVVRSTGPFVPGRVIDLASVAFKRIQPLWRGVATVQVELVN